MRFKSEEYSITNVMSTEDGLVPGICISKKALEWWRDYYRKVAGNYLDTGDRLKACYYQGMYVGLIEILKHFEEEAV